MKTKLHKVIAKYLLCIVTFLGMALNAHAELQSRLNGQAVYDTDLDITWLAEAGTQLSFTDAKQWVANLSVEGVTGWRLPDARTTFNGTSHSLSEMGHLFHVELGADTLPYPPNIYDSTDPDLALFTNIKRIYYWTYNADSNRAVAYSFFRGFQVESYRIYRHYGVWAVHDGDVGGGTPNCIVNCLHAYSFTLTNAITEIRSTIKFADETGAASGARGTVVHVQWKRPDGTIVDQNAYVGTRLRVSFALPVTEPGTYSLTIQDAVKTGYSFDPGNSVAIYKSIVVAPKPNTAKIGDSVWEDTDGDGFRDVTENGLANISVNLLACNGNNVLQSTITDQFGNYHFSNLANGGYQVQFILPTAYHFSPQHAGSNPLLDSNANTTTGKTNCVYVNNGDTKVDYDAGLVPNGSEPEPVVDTVTVIKAVYKRKKRRLQIKANSDALPKGSAVIIATMVINGVETELGTLKWNAKKGYYKQKFYNIRIAPNSIILKSDQGGTVTKRVFVR